MLIRCPTCASRYDLAPELVPEGRILRCAHCRDAWTHSTPDLRGAGCAPEARAVEVRAGAEGPVILAETRFHRPAPAATRPPVRARRRSVRTRTAGLAASLATVALLGGAVGAVAAKSTVVSVFPPSAAVFAVLGVPVNLRGLRLEEVRSAVSAGDGPPTLTLDGRIANVRPGPTSVPSLRIAVRDRDGRELFHWTAPAPKAELAAGETVLFHSRLAAPPADGTDLAISFADVPAKGPRLAEAPRGPAKSPALLR